MLKGRRKHTINTQKDGTKSFTNRGGSIGHTASDSSDSDSLTSGSVGVMYSQSMANTGQTPKSTKSTPPGVDIIPQSPVMPTIPDTQREPSMEVTANYSNTVTTMGSSTKEDSFLEGLVDYNDRVLMHALYRDIYKFDMVAGTAVDLQATLPYSDFTLSGVKDKAILQNFQDSVESLNLKSLMPSIQVDTFVLGEFVGSLGFDNKRRIFSSLVSHNLDNCEFQPLPVYGMDPFVDVTIPGEWQKILGEGTPRANNLKRMIPDYLLNNAGGNKISLNPGATLYLSRNGLTTDEFGSSYFNRILLIHFLEKALIRGTIEQAHRRQRAVAHIIAGTDDWEPTEADLTSLAQLYMNADADPLNAVIATRNGVEIQDVKDPGNMWKFDEIYDLGTIAKLRALGINEAFLSGDANISTMETSLSVLVEQMASNRAMFTRKIFYEKLFPMIAIANGFKNTHKEEARDITSRREANKDRMGLSNRMYKDPITGSYVALCDGESTFNQRQMYERDLTDYVTPRVEWEKKLRPTEDKEYLDLLTDLTEKGLPINLRMIAAAGGMNLDDMIADMDEDVDLRNKIADKKDNLDRGDEGGMEFSSDKFPHINTATIDQIPLSQRKFTGEEMAAGEFDKAGKRRVITPQRKKDLEHKLNSTLTEASSLLAQKLQWEENDKHWKENH